MIGYHYYSILYVLVCAILRILERKSGSFSCFIGSFSIFTLLLEELWMGLFVKLHRFYLHIKILNCSLVQFHVQDVELGNQIVSFLVGLLG